MSTNENSHPEVFSGKGVLKKCSKCTGEHPCRSVISIKLLCNFIEIPLRHECSSVNLLHIFRTSFSKNTSGWLLLTNCKNIVPPVLLLCSDTIGVVLEEEELYIKTLISEQ